MFLTLRSRGESSDMCTLLYSMFSLLAIRAMAQTCYNPDGTANNADYQPCNPGKVSMCCATNRGNSSFLNICRSDGLCLESGTSTNPGTNTVWREGCTDPTWKDPACLKLCAQGFALNLVSDNFLINMTTAHMVITICSDGSMCCGQNNTACCAAGNGYFIRNGVVVNATSSSTTASSSSATTSGSPSQTSASSTSQSSSSSLSSGNGLAIGLGVGLGVAAVLLLALSTFFILKKRRRAAIRTADSDSAEKRHEVGQDTTYSELAAEPRGGALPKGATHGDASPRYSELSTQNPEYLPRADVSELPTEDHGHASQLP